ncbi:MAG: TonB-dependent receptor family protein [Gammaproteobacteria bacterium]
MTDLRSSLSRIVARALALAVPAVASAAPTTEEILVSATRVERDLLRTPFAISVVERDTVQRHQQLGLDESLARIPGAFFQNRYNFAQDLRVSLRGFGARSQFGIRGIKIYVDGIPSTLPDGQGGVDDIDLGSASRIEVLRGPAAALYGAAAGGAINIYTEDGTERPFAEASVAIGEDDFGRYQLKTGGQAGALNYLLNASYLDYGGYRDHAEVEHGIINSKFRYTFSDGSALTAIVNAVDSPTADDPGGLTAAQVIANRKAAAANNLRFDAGESLQQQKAGFVYRKDFGDHHHLQLRNYYIWRDFFNNLAIGRGLPASDGIVAFDRFVLGGGAQYSYDGDLFGHRNRFTLGFDIDAQEDDRQRFININGAQGPLSFDQVENADARGFYFQNEFSLLPQVDLILGGRYDSVDLDVTDRFLANGDQSGGLDFDEFNPMAGIVYSPWRALNLYANYGTSFETPSFTELANPSRDGTLGGFGPVSAQHAKSYEIGVKGRVFSRLTYDLAVYLIDVQDEIISVGNTGGRAFFQNANTNRTGTEASLLYQVLPGLDLTVAYTYADFQFDQVSVVPGVATPAIDGNRLPGQPEHQFYAEVSYTHPSGFYATFDMLHVDEIFANNANTAVNDSYHVGNLRFGRDFRFGPWNLSPHFGINNFFNEDYNQNVILNAVGSRFFEPAPDRNVYGGVAARYTF